MNPLFALQPPVSPSKMPAFTPLPHATPPLPQAMTARVITSLPAVMVPVPVPGQRRRDGDADRVEENPGPKETTKVICADCGQDCEVPFKPTEGRPVYCQTCLPKHRKPRF